MASLVQSSFTVWLCVVCALCRIENSSQYPSESALESFELRPLTSADLKIAHDCLYADNLDGGADSPNTTVCSNAILGVDREMEKGQNYYSPSKAFRLILQSDNNLVLYRECDDQAIFAVHTHRAQSSTRAVMQDDGHFIVYYNDSAEPLWGNETWGYKDSQVFLSDSGYFHLCNRESGCYWRSESQHTRECSVTANHIPDSQYEYKVLAKAGENVALNGAQYSKNTEYYFEKYQTSLVVWRSCDYQQGFKAAWPRNKEIGRATVQSDGNLVIYDADSEPMWSSHTRDPLHAGAELRLYDNGFLYLCTKDGCYWQSSGFMDGCSFDL